MKSRTFDRARYPQALLDRVAAGWRRLAERERHGVMQAARITAAPSSPPCGAPPSILALAAHVVQEEVRHVEVCGSVLSHLGAPGSGRARLVELRRQRAARVDGDRASASPAPSCPTLRARQASRQPPRSRRRRAPSCASPFMAWAYTELLHDETRHATFGAKAAAWVVRHWTVRQREALWASCLTATPADPAPHLRDPEAEGPWPAARRGRRHAAALDPAPPRAPLNVEPAVERPRPATLI